MSEAVLIGGSRDGFVTEAVSGMKSVNNISLNDDYTGPEYIDLYMPTTLTDKDGREIFVHVGRYDEAESKSYWEAMDDEERDALVESAKKEKADAEAAAEAEKQAEAAKAAEEATSAAAIAAAVTAAIEEAKKTATAEAEPEGEPAAEETTDAVTEVSEETTE